MFGDWGGTVLLAKNRDGGGKFWSNFN